MYFTMSFTPLTTAVVVMVALVSASTVLSVAVPPALI